MWGRLNDCIRAKIGGNLERGAARLTVPRFLLVSELKVKLCQGAPSEACLAHSSACGRTRLALLARYTVPSIARPHGL